VVAGRRIAARTVLWAAGVVASPAAGWLGAERDAAGRIKVAADLSVPGRERVFAIGDTALIEAWDGRAVPGLAPAAKQAGRHVARVIEALVTGGATPPPFRYVHQGSLATIGRKAAVVDLGRLRLTGALAWWLWGAIHVGFLVGVRNRVSVLLDWFWSYLTFESGTRLITAGVAGTEVASAQRDLPATDLPSKQRDLLGELPPGRRDLPAGIPSRQRDLPAAELDHVARHADPAVGGHLEEQPARLAERLALRELQPHG
jgi:hypothetical protein